MGRQNTIVFGSQVGTPGTPRPRTGTLVQERSVVGRARSNEPASPHAPRSPLPPVSAPPRYGSDPGPVSTRAPASSRFESQWFAPTNPKLSPVGPEVFEERRGWQPPPASRGLVFTAVSVLLVGVAAAGTFFLLGPDANRSHATPVSTTTITNAEVPAAPEPAPALETTTVPTVTPADLPAAPPVVNAVKEPSPPGWRAAKGTPEPQKASAVAPAPRTQQRAMAPAKPATAKPAAAKPSDTSLPNLDRAAAAAGMTPQQDDPFATPGTETPPAPTAPQAAPPTIGTTQQAIETAPETSAPSTAPAPSDVMPDLQIKR